MTNAIWTLGYGGWPTQERLNGILNAIQQAGITTLVDVRHSPCPSQANPHPRYGPRDWHLLSARNGLDGYVQDLGIDYVWLGELGNPQTNDHKMAILREQLEQADQRWPVNRGLFLLNRLVRKGGNRCCLLCACKDYDVCHRKVIAEALAQRFFAGHLAIYDLRK